MDKLLINFFGCPHSGKTTIMSGVYTLLKLHDIKCEMANDYPKEIMFEHRLSLLDKQYYIFSKQLKRIEDIYALTDIVLTDSPVLINLIYNKEKNENKTLYPLVIEAHNRFNNVNFFIQRTRPIAYGFFKLKSESEIRQIEEDIKRMLCSFNHVTFQQKPETINLIFAEVARLFQINILWQIGGQNEQVPQY